MLPANQVGGSRSAPGALDGVIGLRSFLSRLAPTWSLGSIAPGERDTSHPRHACATIARELRFPRGRSPAPPDPAGGAFTSLEKPAEDESDADSSAAREESAIAE